MKTVPVKISEVELIESFGKFLINQDLIDYENSHFSGDDNHNADVALSLKPGKWPGIQVDKLHIEVKSHHSEDSQNTINKIFGQLLKETGKRSLDKEKECLAILFPYERGAWPGRNNKTVTRIEGEAYYRRGFSRIDKQTFVKFGDLVGAKYILSFSTASNTLNVFEWKNFLDEEFSPMISLTNGSSRSLRSLGTG
ncbi:hypothetical protein [Aquipseudomonas alcaligenes]|uniref:hypothetical protein n=1 Tax=Aquipseudomonas alcaligenes TaxID=43263 RepID=UPI000A98BC17|nr:hypothetical protein [Pseudomonas alcaligenes]